MIPALAVPKTSFPSSRQFPCGAGSVWCRRARALGGPSSPAGAAEWIGSEGRGGGCWLLHLDPIRDDPMWGRQPERGVCGAVLPAQRGALCSLAGPTGCGFLRKEGVLFGLHGCLSSATSQCLWLPVSVAMLSLWAAGGELAGLARWVLCDFSVVLVGRAPTTQCSQNHGSPMLGALGSWARWSEQGWVVPSVPISVWQQ